MNMIRLLRTGLVLCLALPIASTLVCCVNLKNEVQFYLVPTGETVILSVSMSRLGFYTNIHGGNSDSYDFILPKGLNHVKSDQIIEYYVNHKKQPMDFAKTGEIDFTIGPTGCELVINLFSADGQAIPVNGKHRMNRC